MDNIREATEADLPAITEKYNDAVLHTTSTFDLVEMTAVEQLEWFRSHDSEVPVIVLEEDGIVRGWAALSKWSPKPAYGGTVENSLYVHKDYRGKGYGKKLLEGIIQIASKSSFHTVIARIAGDNTLSISMHEKAGYIKIGTMIEAGLKFGKYIDVVLMEKIL